MSKQCPMAGSEGTWNLKFDFFGTVDPDKSKWNVATRDVSFVFMRKSAGSFWDKLNKGAKLTTLKCDWDKWKDEDDNQVRVIHLWSFDMDLCCFALSRRHSLSYYKKRNYHRTG